MLTFFSYKITSRHILTAIILLAAVLRFWGLGSSEIFHDEGFYAFRSIGYVDYIQNDDQATPIQWFKDSSTLPWWTPLSFHDHPPLFFIIQNIFFRIFGDSLLAARLPSALSGLFSVYLAYLLGKKLGFGGTGKNETAGLLAASLLAVNHIHIWISRSSLLESLQIFLIFLNIYYFFVFLEDFRKWKVFGLTLGLIFLTKYTGFFLVPVYLLYLFFLNSKTAGARLVSCFKLMPAAGLSALIFLPVIIYNFYLWKTTGHFDLQFAYLFGQETPEWQASLGKMQEPFSNLFENLFLMYSIPFLLLSAAGIIYAVFRWRMAESASVRFGLLAFLSITLVLISVGSAFRFIALYAVPLVFFAGAAIYFLSKKLPSRIFFLALAVFIVYEAYFAVEGVFLTFPDFGMVKLDSYFEEVLGNKRSKVLPIASNPHLDRIIQDFGKKHPPAEQPLVIVYDENIALAERLWLFSRRLYYRGILTLTAGQFKSLLKDKGLEYFKSSLIHFVRGTENTSLNLNFSAPDAEELERFLQEGLKLSPEKIIYGRNFLPMFRVYRFTI